MSASNGRHPFHGSAGFQPGLSGVPSGWKPPLPGLSRPEMPPHSQMWILGLQHLGQRRRRCCD
jgi:hypothetical protein